ncbi:hypothetical protein ACVWZ4_001240 [Bradyrhizobium sp. USDA 4472]
MRQPQNIKSPFRAYAGPGLTSRGNPVCADLLRTTSIQNVVGTSKRRVEHQRSHRAQARNNAQILLREMSQHRLKAILGQGAVWASRVPRTTSPAAQEVANVLHIAAEFLNQVLLEIGAGWMGHQNVKALLRRLNRLSDRGPRRCCFSSP